MVEATAESLWRHLEGFDRLLEHRTRLGACVLLARSDEMTFSRLRDLLEETDGAMGTHLRKLEEAKYITVRKAFSGRRPLSWYRLTSGGQERLEKHLTALTALVSGDGVNGTVEGK